MGLKAQDDKTMVALMFETAWNGREAYEDLQWLCENTKGRISGTAQAAVAVDFTNQVLSDLSLDSVWRQEVWVKHWERGAAEQALILSKSKGEIKVPVSALGLSVSTDKDGLKAQIVEVQSFEELKLLGREKIQGKIVFFNRPMNQSGFDTFAAYGGAVNQRTQGPAEAAKYGAIGCLVRSLSSELDDYPHTGVTRYEEDGPKIPAVMISTNGSELLSALLKEEPELMFWFKTSCENLPEVLSYNVVGELQGSEFPDEVVVVGSHLDAWDTGEGAHDNGGGCIQAIEVLRIFKKLGIVPRHTIRAVMFMDEEIAQRGAQVYASEAEKNGERHLAGFESDRGVMTPRSLAVSTDQARFSKVALWQPLFEPYGISIVKRGGGGADVNPIRSSSPDMVLMGLIPDFQRYFRYHHSANDTFDKVDRREMQAGSAATAALIYLTDKYGL